MGRRGGYRKPAGGPRPPSGPGKFSERTDGQQSAATPGLDSPDLQYGDVGRLEAAQKLAPLPEGVAAPKPGTDQRPSGAPMSRGRLPSYIFDMPSALPGEPGSRGLPSGPGEGPEALMSSNAPPDLREQVLQYFATKYDNADARDMLKDYRNQRGVRAEQPLPDPMAGFPAPASPEALPEDQAQPPNIGATLPTPAEPVTPA